MITQEELEILNGLMLGDGCLEKHKNGTNASLRITRASKDKEYLIFHKNKLINLPYCKIRDRENLDKRTNKIYYSSILSTRVSAELTLLYNKWYIGGVKIIPKDLELTPIVLATWFADDGNIIVNKGRYRIKLSTHGFTYDEVIFLQLLILKTFKINMSIYKDNSGKKQHWFLQINSKKEVKNFTEIIDSYLPDEMSRKSDIWRNNKNNLQDKNYPPCFYCKNKKVHLFNKKTLTYKCCQCHRTYRQNRIRKNRTEITFKLIQEINRDYLSNKYTQNQLAIKYNLSSSSVFKILKNNRQDFAYS